MEIVFTAHAMKRIQEREVSLRHIVKCLVNPDRFIIRGNKMHFMKLDDTGTKLLICVCSLIKNSCKIITVIYTSKILKYLKNG